MTKKGKLFWHKWGPFSVTSNYISLTLPDCTTVFFFVKYGAVCIVLGVVSKEGPVNRDGAHLLTFGTV